jgi:nicotinamide-nucleotide amidase
MKAEIISIGTELTTGRNLDTNAQWLSRRLAEVGLPTAFHTTVGDDLDDNLAVFRGASERADVVLTTGGLGPTQDDLTREVLAALAGVPLVEDAGSLAAIEEMFRRRGRVMPERNRVQALFPAGATVLPNTRGTAPGVWMKVGRAYFAAMPGVPSEMVGMFADEVRPRLLALGLAGGVYLERKINCFGAGESAVEEKVADLTRRGHVPEVGITASDAVISLRIFAQAATVADARTQIEPVERIIRERLGELVFGADDEDLATAVAHLLAEKRTTLAVAESVTGGALAAMLAAVPGSGGGYAGGVVAYDARVKRDLLGVPEAVIAEHGVFSPEVAKAMAVGCRTRLRSDLAVATVGVAGPGPEGDVPAGQVCVALATAAGVEAFPYNWPGDRVEVQRRTAKQALNAVRLHLLRGE